MATKTGTIAEFIADALLSMTAKPTDHNPAMEDSDTMDHWRVTIRRGRRSMSLIFSKGSGHKGAEPTLPEVLDCLASDAGMIENARDFADFAAELGLDDDSRKAERSYLQCKQQTERLRRFLGEVTYKRLVWETERE